MVYGLALVFMCVCVFVCVLCVRLRSMRLCFECGLLCDVVWFGLLRLFVLVRACLCLCACFVFNVCGLFDVLCDVVRIDSCVCLCGRLCKCVCVLLVVYCVMPCGLLCCCFVIVSVCRSV